MKLVLQRVIESEVYVDSRLVSKISNGLMVLLGIEKNDTDAEIKLLAEKTLNMRIFTDKNDKMNLSVKDIDGDILVVPNFTLCADSRKGNRPSFSNSEKPLKAKEMYEKYCYYLSNQISNVKKGLFGAHMEVKIINDGPITIILDSKGFSENAKNRTIPC